MAGRLCLTNTNINSGIERKTFSIAPANANQIWMRLNIMNKRLYLRTTIINVKICVYDCIRSHPHTNRLYVRIWT